MSTFLHFLKFLHFDEILKTHALLILLVKISPLTLTINLKICGQLILSTINQVFKFKQTFLLMCTIPQPLARNFWNQPNQLQLLRKRLLKKRFEHLTSLMTSQVFRVKPNLRRKIRIEKLRRRLMTLRKAQSPD